MFNKLCKNKLFRNWSKHCQQQAAPNNILIALPETTESGSSFEKQLNDIIKIITDNISPEKLQYVNVNRIALLYQRRMNGEELIHADIFQNILKSTKDIEWRKVTILLYAPYIKENSQWFDSILYREKIIDSIENLLIRISGEQDSSHNTATFLAYNYTNYCCHERMPDFHIHENSDAPTFGSPETWMKLCDSIVSYEKYNNAVELAGGFYSLIREALAQSC